MSREMELLRRISSHSESRIPTNFIYEIQELLVQPEQEPVVWQVIGIAGFMYVYNKPRDQVYEHHTVNALYLAPPTREPLSEDVIWDNMPENPMECSALAFIRGVKFAEKAHGIGVDDE